MSWFNGSGRSAGTCNACGSPVHDGGQSGYYCFNNGCRNGWGGAGGYDPWGSVRHKPSAQERAAAVARAQWFADRIAGMCGHQQQPWPAQLSPFNGEAEDEEEQQ